MNDKTVEIYPYCYKIKDNCPPCDNNNNPPNSTNNLPSDSTASSDCVYLLAKYLALKSNTFADKYQLDNAHMNVANCLQKYGDMYKTVGIELYVNPKTKKILFPDHQRILSNYNVFLNEIGLSEPTSPKDSNEIDNKIMVYQILLNDKLREIYNEFYQSPGFSELASIMPKEYGIARIMGKNEVKNEVKNGGKNGGKKKTKKNKRRKRRLKTKRRIYNK
jgi:hypothetical protein